MKGDVRLAFLSIIFKSVGLPEQYHLARFVMWLKSRRCAVAQAWRSMRLHAKAVGEQDAWQKRAAHLCLAHSGGCLVTGISGSGAVDRQW